MQITHLEVTSAIAFVFGSEDRAKLALDSLGFKGTSRQVQKGMANGGGKSEGRQ